MSELETVLGAVAREAITAGKMHRPWPGLLAEQAATNCGTLEMLH